VKSKKISEVKNSMNRKRKVTKVKAAKSILLLENLTEEYFQKYFRKILLAEPCSLRSRSLRFSI